MSARATAAALLAVMLAACGRHGFESIGPARGDGALVDTPAGTDDIGASGDSSQVAWQDTMPVGYYPFDGSATDVAYAPGTFTCTGCTYQAGYRGMAVRAPSLVNIPNHSTAGASFTVTFRLYSPTTFAGGFSACGTFVSAETSFEINDSPSRITLFPTMGNLSMTTSGAVPEATWVHIAVTSNATTRILGLFVDGVSAGSTGAGVRADSLSGSRLTGGDCGLVVDELFLFDRVLTPAEIVAVRDL